MTVKAKKCQGPWAVVIEVARISPGQCQYDVRQKWSAYVTEFDFPVIIGDRF